MWRFPADLVTFTDEILNGKLHFLCSEAPCNFHDIRPEACNFIKKETLAQVFFCEFCEISKNTFSYRTPPVAASENTQTFDDMSLF